MSESCAHFQPALKPSAGAEGWLGIVVCGGVYEADVSRDNRKEKSPSLLGLCLTVQSE
ncbi:hypothetical protein BD311DRAFT_745165 [Dichomitus squalens]|uniref:Uncharacterized protein n=1 Tax=Dichomitus squalens TaxID=114155 RepID=A0A4Q9N7K8_9APHY|nr:hypothetical protein BD311DRAFT_745165 [Dichomitus squalens]